MLQLLPEAVRKFHGQWPFATGAGQAVVMTSSIVSGPSLVSMPE